MSATPILHAVAPPPLASRFAHGLYFYRHQRTHQLLTALSPSHLRHPDTHAQLSTRTRHHPPLRRDLWTPFLILTSSKPSDARVGEGLRPEVWRGLRQSLLLQSPALPTLAASPSVRKEKRYKQEIELETPARLSQLVRVLHRWHTNRVANSEKYTSMGGVRLTAWWENDAWVELIREQLRKESSSGDGAPLDWPEWVEHRGLVLGRGRHILNEDICTPPPPLALQ